MHHPVAVPAPTEVSVTTGSRQLDRPVFTQPEYQETPHSFPSSTVTVAIPHVVSAVNQEVTAPKIRKSKYGFNEILSQ